MKYIVILGDGMADHPIAALGGRTVLQAALKPNIDRLAREGRCGMLHTISDPTLPAGSETANLAVMGYDPHTVLQGRGVLEAAAMGVDIGPGQVAMRCNLICIEDGRIKNHSAGHISTEEAAEIVKTLNEKLGREGLRFHAGVSYRHLLVVDGISTALDCAQPHDHPDGDVEALKIKPTTPDAESDARMLNELTRRSWEILRDHPVNARRRAAGLSEATSIWVWSPGTRPAMWTYKEHFGISGAMISAVDLLRGIAVYAGLEVIDVPGATGLWETNYEGKAAAAIEALHRHDFVYIHLEGPDEAGHEGNYEHKRKAIEWIDERLLGPMLTGLKRHGMHARIGLLPDHATPVATRVHTREPVPFLIWEHGEDADACECYDEESCRKGSHGELRGDGFIRELLRKQAGTAKSDDRR